MPSNVLVSNFPDNQYNGLYIYSGTFNGKPRYNFAADTGPVGAYIGWQTSDNPTGGYWFLEHDPNYCIAPDNAEFPWLITTTWIDDSFGLNVSGLVMTEVPAFGLPVDARNAKYATATEAGAVRFRRLAALGYV